MAETDFYSEYPYFNREQIQTVLKKRLKAFLEGYHQNVALIGAPYLGKSHILRKFALEDHGEQILPLYIELQNEPFEYFAQRFMGVMLYGILKTKGKIVAGDFGTMVAKARHYIPRTLGRMRLIKKLLMRGRLKECYSSLLALPRILSEELGLKILLILDEFDRLTDYGLKDPFKDLGTELMMQKDTLFVISSSRFQESKEILKGKLTLLFGNFEIIEAKPLSFEESRKFIKLFLGPVEIKDAVVKFLIQLTDGYPFYLHILLEQMKSLALVKGQSITENLMAQALTRELFSEHGVINRFFSSRIRELNQGKCCYLYLTTLLGIALGKRRVRELSRYLERPQSDVKKILNRLVDREIVVRSGNFHTLPDPLYVFWLKFVFAIQKRDLGIHSLSTLKSFEDKLWAAYELFIEEDKKDPAARIEEIFKEMTREDVFEVSGKRFRGFDFTEVSRRSWQDGALSSVLAKSTQGRWLCQISEKPVGENEVGEFIENLERSKRPVKNKILVTLSGIGIDAKLLAQESRINIWDLKNLNSLLGLFGKNKVIPNG